MTPSVESAMSTGASSCPVQGLQMLPLVTPIHSTAKESVWLARPTATTIKPKGGTWNWWIWVKVYDEWRQLKCKWKCKITVTLNFWGKKIRKKKTKLNLAKVEKTHILIGLVGYISLYFSLGNTYQKVTVHTYPLNREGYINLTFTGDLLTAIILPVSATGLTEYDRRRRSSPLDDGDQQPYTMSGVNGKDP